MQSQSAAVRFTLGAMYAVFLTASGMSMSREDDYLSAQDR